MWLKCDANFDHVWFINETGAAIYYHTKGKNKGIRGIHHNFFLAPHWPRTQLSIEDEKLLQRLKLELL